ncbi:unnamed protein product [Sphenostylis stenocarpa]|uniref:Uncharacterized protein n=1 Tax=Sphenostylis stenocarpa TaxID=92480 RepID=A0AA86SD28_9FABA|nr:unnamed protein product [Sphenostylis stenocarpa]
MVRTAIISALVCKMSYCRMNDGWRTRQLLTCRCVDVLRCYARNSASLSCYERRLSVSDYFCAPPVSEHDSLLPVQEREEMTMRGHDMVEHDDLLNNQFSVHILHYANAPVLTRKKPDVMISVKDLCSVLNALSK